MILGVQESEIIIFLLGIGSLIFIQFNRQQLRRLPSSGTFLTGFYLLLAGWALSILEQFLFEDFINFVQHACFAAGWSVLATWCWLVFGKQVEDG
ncbi:MAG: hypothetical protein ACFFD4_32995 [Candidatus Odinarchaeota archaeon]